MPISLVSFRLIPMKYYNFDLRIDKQNGQYSVTARSETLGEAHAPLSLDLDSQEIKDAQQRLLQGESDEDFLKDFGGSLCGSLFQGDVRDLYRASLGQMFRDDDRGLRVRLCVEPPEISALPWELLYDRSRDRFLAVCTETPLTRYIDQTEPIRNLKIEPPLKVLAAIPAGSGFESGAEKAIITSALQELRDVVEIDFLDGAVTRSTISRALVKERYHVFHFIGHGCFQEAESRLRIDSEEKQGESDSISARSLAAFFREQPWMKLLVLSSCQGANVSSTQPLAAMAPELVKCAVPAVIAMQYPVAGPAASVFVKEFYCKLCVGYDRGLVDSAVSHARNRVQMDFPDDKAFAAPALFMRSPTGLIFDLEPRDSVRTLLPPIESIHRLQDVKKTCEINIAALKTAEEGAAAKDVEEEMADRIQEEKKNLADVQTRIRRHYKTAGAFLLSSLVVAFASYVGLLDVFKLDYMVERKFAQYMDSFGRGKGSPEVVLILARENPEENGGLGKMDRKWRQYHAVLIKGLAEAGAKAIVLDLRFVSETEWDDQLGKAIVAAAPTPVIIGAGEFSIANGEPVPNISPALGKIFGDSKMRSRWGIVEGEPELRKLKLAQRVAADAPAFLEQITLVPSLALQTIIQIEARNRGKEINAVLNSGADRILLVDSNDGVIKSIAVDKELDFAIDIVEPKGLQRRSYHDVYEACKKNAPDLSQFRGKIVLIGAETSEDAYDISSTERRYGIELQASAISNMLEGDYIKSLPTPYQCLMILLMGAVGVLMQTRFKRWTRYTVPLVPPKFIDLPLKVPVVLLAIILVYLFVVFVVYKQYRLVLDIEYTLASLILTYVTIGTLRKGIKIHKT